MIAGITYNFLPFMVLPIYASLERLDPRLIEAAKDLYSTAEAFMKVTLPLSAPGIVAGTLLTFIPAAGDYVNAQFLGSTNQMIGNAIQSLYLKLPDYPTAAALSFILMAVILAIVLIYIRFAGSEALMGTRRRPDERRLEVAALARGQHLGALAIVYLLLPIAVIAVFSFNNPAGSFNFSWSGFTI